MFPSYTDLIIPCVNPEPLITSKKKKKIFVKLAVSEPNSLKGTEIAFRILPRYRL